MSDRTQVTLVFVALLTIICVGESAALRWQFRRDVERDRGYERCEMAYSFSRTFHDSLLIIVANPGCDSLTTRK